jgi:predicted Zn-dependent protease
MNMNQGLQFLSLTWTDRIPDNEALIIVREVHLALRQANMYLPSHGSIVTLPEVKPFGYWILKGMDPNDPYCSTQWYIDRSFDPRSNALLGWRYLDVVLNEPYQHHSPHYDLAVMHHPLLDEELGREVFGVAVPGRAAVVSCKWLNQLSRDYERPLVLRRLIAHYVGQVVGIPFPIHGQRATCTGLCAMRPARDLQEWIAFAQEEFQAERIFCDACRRQLSARIASNQFGMN